MSEPLLALTVHQPFASLLVEGFKPVENRSWPPTGRDVSPEDGRLIDRITGNPRSLWIAVHASATLWKPGSAHSEFDEFWGWVCGLVPSYRSRVPDQLPRSALLGLLRIDAVASDMDREDCPWSHGPVCWMVGAAIPLEEPIKARGAQKLWKVKDQGAVRELRAAWSTWKEAQATAAG